MTEDNKPMVEKTDQLEQCPWCGAVEIYSTSPRTTYSCGSSCYDQREGTWQQSALCRQREEDWYERCTGDQEDYDLESFN